MASRNLTNIATPLKVLFSGYLLVIGIGLLMSGAQILLTHGMADGKFGFSVDDIVYSYYGNRGGSRLEVKLEGTMKDKADSHDRAAIVKWVQNGATKEGWESETGAIFAKNCVKCHGTIPGLADFTTWEKVKPLAQFDEGATVDALTMVSHIHLFGIAFIFFFVCMIFSLAVRIPALLKSIAIGAPFLFLTVDIFSWWMTKWYPSFAYLTILGGLSYNLAAAYMILVSLWQMWVWPLLGRPVVDDPWQR